MADTEDFDAPETTEDSAENNPQWIKDLRRDAKAKKASDEARDKALRELAMLKAGVDVDSPQGRLFAKAFDGEPTVDAIRAAATEYGVQTTAPEVPAAEMAALGQINDASAGGGSPSESTQFQDRMNKVAEIVRGEGGGWEFNPDGVNDMVQVLKDAGVPIDYNKGHKWAHGDSAESGATPRSLGF